MTPQTTPPQPRHHPSHATLACHAAGALPGPAVPPVALHLRACPICRAALARIEAAAGAAFAAVEPAGMAPGALAAAMLRLDAPPDPPPPAKPFPDLSPRPLERAGPGIGRRLLERDAEGHRLWLVRVAPGAAVPWHKHTGTELTFFLSGAFRDNRGLYRPGDLREYCGDEADRLECSGRDAGMGLLALEGPLRFRSPLARLFVRRF